MHCFCCLLRSRACNSLCFCCSPHVTSYQSPDTGACDAVALPALSAREMLVVARLSILVHVSQREGCLLGRHKKVYANLYSSAYIYLFFLKVYGAPEKADAQHQQQQQQHEQR